MKRALPDPVEGWAIVDEEGIAEVSLTGSEPDFVSSLRPELGEYVIPVLITPLQDMGEGKKK